MCRDKCGPSTVPLSHSAFKTLPLADTFPNVTAEFGRVVWSPWAVGPMGAEHLRKLTNFRIENLGLLQFSSTVLLGFHALDAQPSDYRQPTKRQLSTYLLAHCTHTVTLCHRLRKPCPPDHVYPRPLSTLRICQPCPTSAKPRLAVHTKSVPNQPPAPISASSKNIPTILNVHVPTTAVRINSIDCEKPLDCVTRMSSIIGWSGRGRG